MKKFALVFCVASFFLSACQQADEGTTVLLKVAEGQKSPKVILTLAVGDTLAVAEGSVNDDVTEKSDGVHTDNRENDGFVTFKIQNAADTIIGMFEISERSYWPVVLDGEPLQMDLSNETPVLLKGSVLNEKLLEARLGCQDFDDSKKRLGDEYFQVTSQYDEQIPDSVIQTFTKRYEQLLQDEQDFYKKTIETNKDNVIPVFMLSRAGSRLTTEYMEEALGSYIYSNHSALAHVHTAIQGEKNKSVGASLVDFEMNDINGEVRHLSDYVGHGKYTLIDFWASWCGPCRQEMPNVKACYEAYKDKGFQVVGISYDFEQQAWEKAVKDLGITWPQLSDLKGWNNKSSNLYNIKSIPATILYGPDGKVVASNLRGVKLTEKLEELLK
ncbi:MAG: TlpA family protein disulfide reductase [Bacteroidaceae bacterium]